jgi:predicted phosphodiesterase
MRTLLHLSDLHFGRTDPTVVRSVLEFARALRPDLTVVSGDLTQRARKGQFRQARRFLDGIPGAHLTVPGNHDLPLFNPVQRFFDPLGNYRRISGPELRPVHVDDTMIVLGVNTARPWLRTEGALGQSQIEWLRDTLAARPRDLMRLLVVHHPVDRTRRRELWQLGLDVILSGHLHHTSSEPSWVRVRTPHHACLLVEAGTSVSRRLRDENNSFNVLRVERGHVEVEPYVFDPRAGEFVAAPVRGFARSKKDWVPTRQRASASGANPADRAAGAANSSPAAPA